MADKSQTHFDEDIDDDDDTLDDSKRLQYANMPKDKRLTMKYDMKNIRRVGELEDQFREKVGEILNCDPDELPFDLDLSDIYHLAPEDRAAALTDLVKDTGADCSDAINDIVGKLNELK